MVSYVERLKSDNQRVADEARDPKNQRNPATVIMDNISAAAKGAQGMALRAHQQGSGQVDRKLRESHANRGASKSSQGKGISDNPLGPADARSAPKPKGALQLDLEKGTENAMTKPVVGSKETEAKETEAKETEAKKQQRTNHIGLSDGSVDVSGVKGVEVEYDPLEDITLAPSSLWQSPAQDYWSTAEPATDDEKRTFHSNAFQQSALTFGLSLLLGNSVEDAMYTGMAAYAQSEYINTDEYAELVNSGVPEEIVRQGFNSGDWSQVKSWQKDINDQKRLEQQFQMEQQKMAMQGHQFNAGQQFKVEQMNSQIAQFNTKMAFESSKYQSELQAKMIEKLQAGTKGDSKLYQAAAKDVMKLGQDASKYREAMDAYNANKENYSPMEQLGLVYKTAKINDPDSAVREAELQLIFNAVPSVRAVAHKIGKNMSLNHLENVLPAGAAKDLAAYLYQRNEELLKENIVKMVDLDQQVARMGYTSGMERPWYEQYRMDQYDPSAEMYGISFQK